MADVGIPRKDADGRQQRAKTAAASVDSRKCRTDHAVGSDGADNDTATGHHVCNTSVSDGEQPRDARRTVNRSSSVAAIESDPDAPLRLIVVSSKIRNTSVMHSAVLPHVVFVQYKYESATVDSCLGKSLCSDCYMFNLLLVVKVGGRTDSDLRSAINVTNLCWNAVLQSLVPRNLKPAQYFRYVVCVTELPDQVVV